MALGTATSGVDFLVAIETETGTFSTLGGQRSATLKLTADSIDASCKTSDGWKDTIPGLSSWGIEGDALVLSGDSAYEKLLDAFLEKKSVNVKYTRADGSNWNGSCTVTDLSEESPHDGVATYKITLEGIGKPTRTAAPAA